MKKALAVLMAALMLVFSFSLVSAKPVEQTREGIGMNVSTFNARLLQSTNYLSGSSIADYELTFINYWATWCGPCVSEMPHIRTLYNHYESTPELDVQIIGAVSISSSCTESDAANFLNNNGYTWPNVVPDSVLNAVFNTSGYIPQTLVIDRNGVVRDHVVGSFSSYNDMLEYVEMWRDAFNNHEGETVTVSYVSDISGEVLLTQEVTYGSVINVPAASTFPEVYGYNTPTIQVNDSNVYETGYPTPIYIAMGNCTLTVHYNPKTCTVRFYDSITGTKIATRYVYFGRPVEPPAAPEHPGYVFVGWDHDLSCVDSLSLDIYTIYELDGGDIDGDGEVTAADALLALRTAMGMMELTEAQFEEADVDGDGEVTAADALLILRASMNIV